MFQFFPIFSSSMLQTIITYDYIRLTPYQAYPISGLFSRALYHIIYIYIYIYIHDDDDAAAARGYIFGSHNRTVHIVRTSSTWYCTLTPGLFLLQCEGVKYLGRQCINMQGKGWDVKEGSSRRDLKREDRSRRPLLLMTS